MPTARSATATSAASAIHRDADRRRDAATTSAAHPTAVAIAPAAYQRERLVRVRGEQRATQRHIDSRDERSGRQSEREAPRGGASSPRRGRCGGHVLAKMTGSLPEDEDRAALRRADIVA